MNFRFLLTICITGFVWLPAIVRADEAVNDLAARLAATGAWSTTKTDNFTIYYDDKFTADAERAKTHLEKAIAELTREFARQNPPNILKKIDCDFYLHPEPNEFASDGTSMCITRGLEGGRRHADIHFLTPARYRPDTKDSIGESKREDHYFRRYIVHEYASIWLGIIARNKKSGWYANGNDAPNWFWQGYEEYLGMTMSSKHCRTVTFSKYMAVVKNDPDSVLLAHGYRDTAPRIIVGRDYTDGFALLAFMHEQFGHHAVQQILTSEKPTFRDAMQSALMSDEAARYERFQEWLAKWKSPA